MLGEVLAVHGEGDGGDFVHVKWIEGESQPWRMMHLMAVH